MARLFSFLSAVLIFIAPRLEAQETGLSFLRIGLSAREQALGNTGSSSATDAAANYYNPAMLTNAAESSLLLSQNIWVFDTYASYVAANFKRETGAWGVSLSWLTTQDIAFRTRPTADPDGLFNSQNAAFGLSYSRPFGKQLSLAATWKFLYEKLFVDDATGNAFDISAAFKPVSSPLILSLLVQNMGSMSALVRESTKLPTLIRGGASYPFFAAANGSRFLLESNVIKVFSGALNVSVGGEYQFQNFLWLRGGYIFGNESRTLSGGLGLRYGAFRFDYAFVPFQNNLGAANVLSIQAQY
jgi:hypothetical protein